MRKFIVSLTMLLSVSIFAVAVYAATDLNLVAGSEGTLKKYYANNTPLTSSLSVDHKVLQYEVRNTADLSSRELVNVLYRGNGGADQHARVLHKQNRNYLRYYGYTCYYGSGTSCQSDYVQPTNIVISPGSDGIDVIEHWFGAFNSSQSVRYKNYGAGIHFEYLQPNSSYNWNHWETSSHLKVIAGANLESSLRGIFWSTGTVKLNP
ncbi:hypothetical protein [Brevibacillus agri]|uniref:hypothetical protein n=1 Tax=Brevibacillus agri TaxID=51101 RepID=UPI0024C098D1|nr:hypothetical protein [Brevibacillus agri]WHX32539.1 hypothetical protein QNK09_10170 [Brevibacillus agri]